MALSRPSSLKCRLSRVPSLTARIQEPPTAPVPFTNRRQLASNATQEPLLAPNPTRGNLSQLFDAIQKRDTSQISKSFIQWTKTLARSGKHQEVEDLPVSTFSEILRSIDPLGHTKHDVADGLRISQGNVQWSSGNTLVDVSGVRNHHRKLLAGVQTLFDLRSASGNPLTPADYEVLMRCAGVALDFQAVKRFWNAMAAQGIQDSRTARTWTEFIKARFMTEPEYYQFDRSRVMFLARDLVSNRAPAPMAVIKRLDEIRFSQNALQRHPWNRRSDEPDEDIRRVLRRRKDFRSYRNHWIRSQYYGHEPDEELICASMVAFARSSSLRAINTLILDNYYGIQVELGADPESTTISGGYDIPADSPIRPSSQLLNAIVDAYCSMVHIPLALKLVNFISQRYNIPIPHSTWSNLLNWAYTCASKPFSTTRAIHGQYKSTTMSASEVLAVWNAMTSKPYNVSPTFDDYDIYVKALIEKRAFGTAVDTLRTNILPLYEAATSEYQLALTDEILQYDATEAPSPEAKLRRTKAQVHKDHIHHQISLILIKLLKSASQTKSGRTGPVTQVLVPNIITEFADFLPSRVRHRTAQGVAVIDRPDATSKIDNWEWTWRHTTPQKKAGIYSRDTEGSHEPEFAYPTVRSMRILEKRPILKNRLTDVGLPPRDANWRGWWDRLEEEMML